MDIFDAISNELRRKIIKSLDKPKSFSQLSDELKVESSALAFHLKKLDGLISKDEQGNYILTEEGKRALSIINVIENQNISLSNSPKIPMIIQYVDNFVVNENMIRKLKEEGRKLIIKDVNTVEFKEVDPELLDSVLEDIENVITVKCPEDLVNVISSKSKEIISVEHETEETSKNEIEMFQPESLVGKFISAFLPKIRINDKLKIVYDGPLQSTNDLHIDLDGGVIKISKGEPHLFAKCREVNDLDIDKDNIEADGCYIKISYPDLNSLDVTLDGGKIDLSGLKINKLSVDVDGGLINLNVSILDEAYLSIDGGKIDGKISFLPNQNSKLTIDVDGGVGDISIFVPNDIAVISSSNINGGVVTLPKSRIGKNGILNINASINGGVIRVKEE
ncbi:ArsR/SmtB family transcription factor [Acidianus manzaensis]|uniref:Transcriptional regulator n=1 Tax=Acidianus manzaensis TaxID=282676 RepID=A0A1W6K125_9CREN|nr:winged helix-turn-helix domain-containing protein [Acidianus manzaensis]ARM76144.1 transcriptional regulator [Acidianus manzaensis]